MNDNSQETLRRVTQNDPSLTELLLVGNSLYDGDEDKFYSGSSDDYSTLGTAIANNTYLKTLEVMSYNDLPLGIANRVFYDGLRRNSSIHELMLRRDIRNIAGGVGQEILQVYQENNSHLTDLFISNSNLQSGGDRVVAGNLRSCRNLQIFALNYCNITDEQLLTIVDAVRGHRLKVLGLNGNRIGNAGCEAIATLLADPNCNLLILNLGSNAINDEGATTIANSLTNNNKLQKLYLVGNQIDQSVQDVFSNILCNTSSINSTYSSNHTLSELRLPPVGQELSSLLDTNEDDNKSHVAIRKILKFHPNIDMEPLFEWDAEGEHTLKALPYVMNWFERARVAVADEDEEEYNIEERKLSAIFQFAKTMPLLFEGISYISADDKKRKRED